MSSLNDWMNCLCWAQYYRWIWYGFIWEFMVVVVLIQSIFCVAYIMVFLVHWLAFTLLYFTLPWSILSQPNAHYILQWKVFPKSLLSFFFSLCYSLPIQSIYNWITVQNERKIFNTHSIAGYWYEEFILNAMSRLPSFLTP